MQGQAPEAPSDQREITIQADTRPLLIAIEEAKALALRISESNRQAATLLKVLAILIVAPGGVRIGGPHSGLGPNHVVTFSIGEHPQAFLDALSRVSCDLDGDR